MANDVIPQFGQPMPATAPNFDNWKYGVMGGIQSGRDMDNYNKAMSMQDLFNSMQQQRNEAMMKEFMLSEPVRAAARKADIEKSKADELYAVEDRRTKAGTESEKLKQLKIETPVKESQAKTAQMMEALNQAEARISDLQNKVVTMKGPDAVAGFMKWADEAGLPAEHEYRKYIEQSVSPADAQERMQAILNHATNNMKTRRALLVQGAKSMDDLYKDTTLEEIRGEYGLRRQELANQGAKETAIARTQQQERMDQRKAAIFAKLEEVMAMPDGPEKAAAIAKIKELLNMISMMEQAPRAAGAQPIIIPAPGGGLTTQPGGNVNPQVFPPAAQPQQGGQGFKPPPGWKLKGQ